MIFKNRMLNIFAYSGEILISLRIVIADDIRRIAAALDVDQQRGVLHHGLLHLAALVSRGPLHPGQQRPVGVAEGVHTPGAVAHKLYPGCVAHPDLVTLEYLRSAALLAAGPSAVTLAVTKTVISDLRSKSFINHKCDGPHLAVDRISDKLMHHGGDSGVEDKGDKEEKPENANDGQGSEEQGGVVLDLLHAGGRLLRLPHGGVHLWHDDCLLDLSHKVLQRYGWPRYFVQHCASILVTGPRTLPDYQGPR